MEEQIERERSNEKKGEGKLFLTMKAHNNLVQLNYNSGLEFKLAQLNYNSGSEFKLAQLVK